MAQHYLLAGGGTGGHLFPGIAVAEELIARHPQSRILFAGSDRPIEREILATTPFEHVVLPSVSLADAKRHPLRFLKRSLRAQREASRLIDEVRPAVVIGCGGFASAAPVYAAWRQSVPIVLLEQNVIPGRATRWLSHLGATLCLAFGQSSTHLHRRADFLVTGNPVRRTVADVIPDAAEVARRQVLLVLGGSQGARSLNDHLIAFAQHAPEALANWRIIHQTGVADEERVRSAYVSGGTNARVAAFFRNLPALYREAGLVVSRAGATTLAEISCAGLPGLLLPYPHAADNHQWHNALVYQTAGAAVVFEDPPLKLTNQLDFDEALRRLLSDQSTRQTMSIAMLGLGVPTAAARVVDAIDAAVAS